MTYRLGVIIAIAAGMFALGFCVWLVCELVTILEGI